VIHFLDASAIVKRYVRETGSEIVAGLFRGKKALAISRVTLVELPAALARCARRGDIATAAARDAAARFTHDSSALAIVEIRPRIVDRAAALVWDWDLRAYDALQLACAAELADRTSSPVTFVAADSALLRAATGGGLKALAVG
jgi:hypothetical protein